GGRVGKGGGPWVSGPGHLGPPRSRGPGPTQRHSRECPDAAPAAHDSRGPAPARSRGDRRGDREGEAMNVLLVEDSAPTRDLLSRYLGEAGMTATFASRLSTGFERAMAGEFDVIVLDLM